MLRQQEAIADGKPNLSLADFVAARASGAADYIGAFAVTAGIGAEQLARRFEQAHDDYSAILVKALADRLAEAFAAYLHARVRAELGIEDAATPDDVIAERHRGIRPGFGYPACPDHSEKFKLFELLEAGAIGMELTEHAAMTPAASVSGLYFAHPAGALFHRRPDRRGPDRQLRPPERAIDRIGGTVADSFARLRAGPVLGCPPDNSPAHGVQ